MKGYLCFVQYVLSRVSQIFDLRLNLSFFFFFAFCSSFDEERPEVPMLFRDVPSLLIIFVLTMPQPLRKGTVTLSASWHYKAAGAFSVDAPQGKPHYQS